MLESDDEDVNSTFSQVLHDRTLAQQPPEPMEDDEQPGIMSILQASGRGDHLPSVGSGHDFVNWMKSHNGKVFPHRVMCVNLKARYLQPDAKSLLDALTPEDENERAHANGQYSLLTMLFAGTSKGFQAGTLPEIAAMRLNGAEEEDIEKAVKSATPYSSYTFTPQEVENGVVRTSSEHARQIAFFLEYIRNEARTGYWGLRVWKVVMDPSHSDSGLWSSLMQENLNAFNQTTNHAMPDKMRRPNEANFAKESRRMDDKSNLEMSAANTYRWVRTNPDLCKLYHLYAGKDCASPLFENFQQEIDNSDMNKPLSKHETLGGLHKLGPEFALSPRRGFPLTGGMLSSPDDPDRPDPSQCLRANYFPEDGSFCFPDDACDASEVFFSSHAAVRSLMSVPLPIELTSAVKPTEDVLKFYFSRTYQTDPELVERVDLAAVRQHGMSEWSKYEDIVERGFFRMIGGNAATSEMSRLMEATNLISNSSIDLSAAEKVRLKGENITEAGKRPREALVVVAEKVKRGMVFLGNFSAEKNVEIRKLKKAGYAANRERIMQLQRVRDHTMATVLRGMNSFGISLMSRVFVSRRERADVPPGILASHDALTKDIRRFGELLTSGVYRMDPADPRSSAGTANIAFGMGTDQSLDPKEDTDPPARKNAWSMWRRFISALFSDVLKIDGREVRICLEIYQQVFETLFGFSTCLVLPGGPGIGKSMRGARMAKLMPEGCFQEAGSRSEKEGLNAGWNPYCAFARLYDEVPKLFSDKDMEDLAKQIVSDNVTNHARSVRCTTADGIEDFKTVSMYQIRSETHIVPNNEGPLLNPSAQEPSTSKQALYNRCHVQVCFSSQPLSEDEGHANEKEFEDSISSSKNALPIAAFRVGVGLIKKILSYTVPISHLSTKTEHANIMFRNFDAMLVHEFGMERPDSRKETKRDQTLRFICAEASFAEVFFCKQSAANFDFMMPDLVVDPDEVTPENGIRGHLKIWDESQIEPCTRRAAIPTPHEIVAAWSASLDYSERTSAHFFWTLHGVAESVGIKADLRDFQTWTNSVPGLTTPSGGDLPSHPTDEDVGGQPEEPFDPTEEAGVQFPFFTWRDPNLGDADERVQLMEMQRIARIGALRRGIKIEGNDHGTIIENIRRSWANAPDEDLPHFFDPRLGRVRRMTREEMEGFLFPNPFDLLAVGYNPSNLNAWSIGQAVDALQLDPKFGVDLGNWRFEQWQKTNKNPTAAAIDPSWRAAVVTNPPEQSRRWMEATMAVLRHAEQNGCHALKVFGLTPNILRDCIHQLSLWEVSARHASNGGLMFKFEEAMTKADDESTVVEGNNTLSDASESFKLIRPKDASVFRLDSRQKEAMFGRLADYSFFDRHSHEGGGVYGRRLEALVNRGRLPALAPLYSTRVDRSKVIKMNSDNTLLFNTDFLVRFQTLFVEVALANMQHRGLRNDYYNLTLAGNADRGSAVAEDNSPADAPERSDVDQAIHVQNKKVHQVPLHYDALQVFLTTKAIRRISFDPDEQLVQLGVHAGTAVPRFQTRFPRADRVSDLLTIRWTNIGSADDAAFEQPPPTRSEIEDAVSAASAIAAKQLAEDSPEVVEQLKSRRKKAALPVPGNPMSFSNWWSNAFVLGVEAGMWADASDPVFKSIAECTLGVTSHAIENRLLSPAWAAVFDIDRCGNTLTGDDLMVSKAADEMHASDRASSSTSGAQASFELPTSKRPRV